MKSAWGRLAEVTAVLLLLGTQFHATADLITYEVTWEPATWLPSNASAVGLVTIDTASLPNPGTYLGDISPIVRDLSITVTGAGSGDGTFHLSDYALFYWNSGVIFPNFKVDLTRELVGQSLPDGTGFLTFPSGEYGEFNFVAKCRVGPLPYSCPHPWPPSSVETYSIGAPGYQLTVTSIRPISIIPVDPDEPGEPEVPGIPEPATMSTVGLALIALVRLRQGSR